MKPLLLTVFLFATLYPSVGSLVSAQTATRSVTPDTVGERDGLIVLLSTGAPLDGTVTYLSSAGQLERSIEYRKGRKEGLVQVYDNHGRIVAREAWLAGVRYGLSEEFFPNGEIKKQVGFVADQMSGEYKIFDEAGRLRISGAYVQSRKAGFWVVYSSDFEIIERVRFQNGVLKSEVIDDSDIEREHKARSEKRPSR